MGLMIYFSLAYLTFVGIYGTYLLISMDRLINILQAVVIASISPMILGLRLLGFMLKFLKVGLVVYSGPIVSMEDYEKALKTPDDPR